MTVSTYFAWYENLASTRDDLDVMVRRCHPEVSPLVPTVKPSRTPPQLRNRLRPAKTTKSKRGGMAQRRRTGLAPRDG
jgi:hypothetical protein